MSKGETKSSANGDTYDDALTRSPMMGSRRDDVAVLLVNSVSPATRATTSTTTSQPGRLLNTTKLPPINCDSPDSCERNAHNTVNLNPILHTYTTAVG